MNPQLKPNEGEELHACQVLGIVLLLWRRPQRHLPEGSNPQGAGDGFSQI